MLCKNCGKELPITGKFCPYCAAPIEQTGVNDETVIIPPIPEEEFSPIDLSAFDAVLQQSRQAAQPSDPLADDLTLDALEAMPPISVPAAAADAQEHAPQQRTASTPRSTAPRAAQPARTTYFDPSDQQEPPFRKPSRKGRAAVIVLVIVLVLGLIGAGVFFVLQNKPDESLEQAEKYLERGKFDDALAAFEAALADAKDPAAIQLRIDQLRSYQQAQALMEDGDYISALATLNDLKNRLTDPDSALADAVDDLIEQATLAQSDSDFAADIDEVQNYLDDEKYDAAQGKLDSLTADDMLTDEQRKQVEKLQDDLKNAQETLQRQQENEQAKQAARQSFSQEIDSLEESDRAIASADTIEKELEMTSTSFEAWDTLLADMYDYLASVLNADQYAAEQENYRKWIEERDAGAKNAAEENSGEEEGDKLAGQLAAESFKQSYTKTRCYKVLDMM